MPDSNPESLLAVRNLQRGRRLKLPSGQEVARRMGITPLTNEQLAMRYTLKLNKDTFAFIEEHHEADAELGPIITHPVWNGEAPLWFYILKEAELIGKIQQVGPTGQVLNLGAARLGPVGGRIVAEVLVGLLQRDPNSYLYLNPSWKPSAPIAPRKDAKGNPIFELYDLLQYAGVWS